MKLGEKQELFTSYVAELIFKATELGFKCRMREVQRTVEQQQIYIDEGRSTTMNSKHLNSLAVDMYFTKNGKLVEGKDDLQELGDYWESMDNKNKWGGNWHSFTDCPHFEYGG